ncbi:uncharacterized protein LOC126899685 isoform X2 [Daktulosphaira vitifoliae]|uniref:uncharacterized protein LOC126899685 isoform X2 n=1 Tax=Daktulosphaira vitifoliae TaxID=58002 RepID=UPI0021A9CE57|nr:uncharacterized protein LOC126899685 isoform X2 [Daktulosphaira vitifoliae]
MVKSDDQILQINQDLLNCFNKCGLVNNDIIQIDVENKFTLNFENKLLDWNTLIQKKDENNKLNIVEAMTKYVCSTFKGTSYYYATDDGYKNCLENAHTCCNTYVQEVSVLNITAELNEMVIKHPCEYLVNEKSEEKKGLPTIFEDDSTIINTKCQKVKDVK